MPANGLMHKVVRKYSICGNDAGLAVERLRLLHKTFTDCFPACKACGPPQFISRKSTGLDLYWYCIVKAVPVKRILEDYYWKAVGL